MSSISTKFRLTAERENLSYTLKWEISLREASSFMYKININIIFYSISNAHSRNTLVFHIKMYKSKNKYKLIRFAEDKVDTSGRLYSIFSVSFILMHTSGVCMK